MKKKLVLLLSVVLVMSSLLCACGTSLTDEQKDMCEKVDDFYSYMATNLDMTYSSKIKKVDGYILHIGILNYDGDITDENAQTFSDLAVPDAEKTLHKVDIYHVLYLNEYGENEYRIIDSQLDPNILD